MSKMIRAERKGLGIKSRRVIAYVTLAVVSFFCLFWFYVLFINSTRSHSELTRGFTVLPSTHLLENMYNIFHGTLPIWNGMLNSLLVSTCSAVLCVYFSAMTAYAIHAYEFKWKKFMFTFILMIMMIPTQVNALGFIQLIGNMKLDNSFIPFDHSVDCITCHILLY